MKKQWNNPKIDILDISATMAGQGPKYPDCLDTSSENMPPGWENNKCLEGS